MEPPRFDTQRRIRVRITRPPPAPLMDGHAVGHFVPGVQYRLSERLGRYLIAAGYVVAEPCTSDSTPDSTADNQRRRVDDEQNQG